MAQKWAKKASKWGQNDTKKTTKRCQNDPKVTQNDPDRRKTMVQNHLKMAIFCSKVVQSSLGDVDAAETFIRPKKGPKKSKTVTKKMAKTMLKRHLGLHKSASKHSKSTQDTSRHANLLHFHGLKRRF